MNHKFLKNLKLYCRIKRESFEIWKKAYLTMPENIKKKFKLDISRFAKQERQDKEERKDSSGLTN